MYIVWYQSDDPMYIHLCLGPSRYVHHLTIQVWYRPLPRSTEQSVWSKKFYGIGPTRSSGSSKRDKYSKTRNPIQCLNPTQLQPPSSVMKAETLNSESRDTSKFENRKSLQRMSGIESKYHQLFLRLKKYSLLMNWSIIICSILHASEVYLGGGLCTIQKDLLKARSDGLRKTH